MADEHLTSFQSAQIRTDITTLEIEIDHLQAEINAIEQGELTKLLSDNKRMESVIAEWLQMLYEQKSKLLLPTSPSAIQKFRDQFRYELESFALKGDIPDSLRNLIFKEELKPANPAIKDGQKK